jgi:hypothetical protein
VREGCKPIKDGADLAVAADEQLALARVDAEAGERVDFDLLHSQNGSRQFCISAKYHAYAPSVKQRAQDGGRVSARPARRASSETPSRIHRRSLSHYAYAAFPASQAASKQHSGLGKVAHLEELPAGGGRGGWCGRCGLAPMCGALSRDAGLARTLSGSCPDPLSVGLCIMIR